MGFFKKKIVLKKKSLGIYPESFGAAKNYLLLILLFYNTDDFLIIKFIFAPEI